jgi:hypothetical protein
MHRITFKSNLPPLWKRGRLREDASLALDQVVSSLFLSHRELEPGGVVIFLPRPQQHRREMGL